MTTSVAFRRIPTCRTALLTVPGRDIQRVIVHCSEDGSLMFRQDIIVQTLREEFSESGHAVMFANSKMDPRSADLLVDELRSMDRSPNSQIVPVSLTISWIVSLLGGLILGCCFRFPISTG